MGALGPCIGIFHEDVLPERWRQLKKWGDQSHLPDGTAHQDDSWLAIYYRGTCEAAAAASAASWRDILLEEVYEALAESEREPLRAELVQVAAVALAWIQAIDNRAGDRAPLPPDPAVLDEGALLSVAA